MQETEKQQAQTAGCAQSTRPEDTRLAREEGLVAEDFEDLQEEPELTREQILACDDRQIERVPCPEWGGVVYVRNVSGQERNQFEQESTRRKGKSRDVNMKDLMERVAVLACCNARREPLFTGNDVCWLREKNAAPLARITSAAFRLGGWTEEDIEDLVGNSRSGPSSSGT